LFGVYAIEKPQDRLLFTHTRLTVYSLDIYSLVTIVTLRVNPVSDKLTLFLFFLLF